MYRHCVPDSCLWYVSLKSQLNSQRIPAATLRTSVRINVNAMPVIGVGGRRSDCRNGLQPRLAMASLTMLQLSPLGAVLLLQRVVFSCSMLHTPRAQPVLLGAYMNHMAHMGGQDTGME